MEFKDNAKIITSDFWYDITEGCHIKPEEILKNKEDIEEVVNALKILYFFLCRRSFYKR